MKTRLLLILVMTVGALAARGMVRSIGAAGATHAHWGYHGADGPEHWGELDASFSGCAHGRAQSPINLTGAKPADLPNILFHYQPTHFEIVNNGHTIQANGGAGSWIQVDGAVYKLLQFHFHTPSEHTVGGKRFPLELHLVHQDERGHLAVVGVLCEQSAALAALAPLWQHLPARAGERRQLAALYNPSSLLPADRRSYRYAGSLTTPACTEGVRWMVMKQPVGVSQAQVETFKRIFPFNSRPVQPLNGRQLVMDTTR